MSEIVLRSLCVKAEDDNNKLYVRKYLLNTFSEEAIKPVIGREVTNIFIFGEELSDMATLHEESLIAVLSGEEAIN